MATVVYNSFLADLGKANVDFENDTLKLALLTSSYSVDIDAHDFYDDLTNEVSNGNGYTTGGETATSVTVTQDDTNDRAVFDSADFQWTSATFTFRYAVLYKSTGTGSTSPLIIMFDLGQDVAPVNGQLDLTIHATNGFMTIAQA